MKTRKLGNQGPLVSAIGLGCMGRSEFCGARNVEESLAILNRALDLGVPSIVAADPSLLRQKIGLPCLN